MLASYCFPFIYEFHSRYYPSVMFCGGQLNSMPKRRLHVNDSTITIYYKEFTSYILLLFFSWSKKTGLFQFGKNEEGKF